MTAPSCHHTGFTSITNGFRWRHAKHAQQAAKLAQRLKDFVGLRKIGSLGGDNETQFEQSLAQLGWTYMSDKAPQLLDYLVGFQLVERNNDNTKAVGVFGFHVGNSWIYAPVFFINGEVKGHELMYLKDHDLFVPLDESWTNYVISQQQQPTTGHPVLGTSHALGVRQPDITPLLYPAYQGKYAAARVYRNVPTAGWLSPTKGFSGVYSALTQPSLEKSAAAGLQHLPGLSVSEVLEQLMLSSTSMCKAALDVFDSYPGVERLFNEFHGSDFLEKALLRQQAQLAKQASQGLLGSPPAAAPVEASPVRLLTRVTPALTEKQATEIATQGYTVEDQRDRTKLSEALVRREKRFVNPTETGLYELLTAPGEFKRCLIVISPQGSDRRDNAVVVEADGEHRYFISHPANLFVKQPGPDRHEFESWLDDLSSYDKLDENATWILVSARGASVPFRVYTSHNNGVYEVSSNYYTSAHGDKPSYMQSIDRYARPHTCSDALELVHWQQGKGNGFRYRDSELETSSGAKAIRLGRREMFVQPGNLLDAELLIQTKSAALRIRTDSYEGTINHGRPQSKIACFWSLVEEHGFDTETARELMKLADARSVTHDSINVRVIYGEGYPRSKQAQGPLDGQHISAPAIPDPTMGASPFSSGAVEQYPLEQFLPIDGLGSSQTDPSVYDTSPEAGPDPMLMQLAQQAGGAGQKELFDTNMLKSMVKSVRQGSTVHTFSKDLMRALDRLGRILFLFYWHNDEFADRYGKSDLPELEDAVRNSFETLGELVLFLKEKDVEPLSSQQLGAVDVESVAD